MKLTYMEYSILSSLKKSLSRSFQTAGTVFSADPVGYARAVERLTTTESYGRDSKLGPAPTTVNEFVFQEKQKLFENLMKDVTPEGSNEAPVNLWVVVQMLEAEALLEYRPDEGSMCITAQGLSALRQAR